MIEYIYNDPCVLEFVAADLGISNFSPCTNIGVLNNGTLIAGVIYNNYQVSPGGKPISIEITMSSVSPKWCSRSSIFKLLAYPFVQLKVKRLQATCSKSNIHVHSFLERIGFTYEGIAREAWPLGGDSVVYSMLNNECKWL